MITGTEMIDVDDDGIKICPFCHKAGDSYENDSKTIEDRTHHEWHCDTCNHDWIETWQFKMWEEGALDD